MLKVGRYEIDESLLPHITVVSGGVGRDLAFESRMNLLFGAHIHAYDFTPLAADFWAENMTGLHNVNLYREAISVRPWVECFVTESLDAISSSEYASHPNRKPTMQTMRVPANNLSMLLLKHGKIDVLKLDIEGSEADVLMSMTPEQAARITQLCFETHFHIIPELQGNQETLLAHLEGLGYKTGQSSTNEFWATRKSC